MATTTVEEVAAQNEKLTKMIEDLSSELRNVTTIIGESGIGQPGGHQARASASSAPAPSPAVPTPGLVPATGTYLSGGSMSVPKFNGDGSKFPLWRRRITTVLLQAGCRTAIDPTHNPVLIGDDSVGEVDLHACHGAETVRKASHAWSILMEAVTYSPLISRMYKRGSPSGAWAEIETWYAPRGKAQRSIWKDKFEHIRMQQDEDPHAYVSRIDEAVDMLACLEIYRDEDEIIDAINRGLTKDYETECRALLRQPGICRADVESILRERYDELKRGKKGGGHHALFAGVPSRGGRSGGGRGGHGGGTRHGNGRGRGQGRRRDGNDNEVHRGGRQGPGGCRIANGIAGMYWPSVGPYPANLRQPVGNEPALHHNDPRARCSRCDQIGHARDQCSALLTLSCDPNPPTAVLMRQRFGNIAIGTPQPQAPAPPPSSVGSFAPPVAPILQSSAPTSGNPPPPQSTPSTSTNDWRGVFPARIALTGKRAPEDRVFF